MRISVFLIPIIAAGCANEIAPPDSQVVHLASASETCDSPIELCTLSEPMTCTTYCEEPAPPGGDDCAVSPDGVTSCGGVSCVHLSEPGAEEPVVSCPSDDCVVSYDVATGVETVTCPADPGGTDGSEPGGTEPGTPGTTPPCSGDRDGDGVCDAAADPPAPSPDCPDGGDGSPECPYPL